MEWFKNLFKTKADVKPDPVKTVDKAYGLNTPSISISQNGLDLIKKFEGFRSKAYLDIVGVPTIGFGSTAGVKLGQVVTETEAETMLRRDVKKFEAAIKKAVTVPLTQNQFDALVSWTYNVGSGAMANSTLVKFLNMKEYKAAADQLLRWDKAGGKKVSGLTKRRTEERKLFLK